MRRSLESDCAILIVANVLLVLLALAVCGCSSDEGQLVDERGCPGGLLCECAEDRDCDGYGVGGMRGSCVEGFCSQECSNALPCDPVVDAIACGPLTVGAGTELVTVCEVPCSTHDEPCDALGMPGARCITVAPEAGELYHVCAHF